VVTGLTAEESSTQLLHIQLDAWGTKYPLSISVCSVLPPKRIDRFQSLLFPLPQRASNSVGVNHWSPLLMHFPLFPDPNLALNNSAFVSLHLIGSTEAFTASSHVRCVIGWCLLREPPPEFWFIDCGGGGCCCCWFCCCDSCSCFNCVCCSPCVCVKVWVCNWWWWLRASGFASDTEIAVWPLCKNKTQF